MNELNPFEYQKPNEEQIQQIEKVRNMCSELYIYLRNIEIKNDQSLTYINKATDKLQEVSMWTNKSITFNK